MNRDHEIQRDLGLKLSRGIEELMQREMSIAQRVLPASNVVILLLNTAIGVNASVVSAALQARKPGTDPGAVFDIFASSIAQSLAEHKPKVLDGVALMEAGNVAEAVRRYGADRR